ncbi:hypothetical protein [Kerstersia gyiorum]|uniref:AbrB/MazE/SpoVT family DNA-binding domain-containing protein n=1 Tax=Kerstersia gyiorum TaxID=206506 RepID=UPI0009FD62FF|nr:hypothetical protein [Kerstersia gyiorum]
MSDNRSDNPVPTDANAMPEKFNRKPRYTLDELLSQCDPSAELTKQEREWVDAPAVGRELV